MLLLLLVLPCAASLTTRWSIHTWQSDDGLPHNNVLSLALGADGHLWIATASYPARFDGVVFELFDPKVIKPDFTSKISTVHQAKSGLWMGTDRGQVLVLRGSASEVITHDLPDRVAQTLLEDPSGTLWVGYRAGFLRLIREGRAARFGAAEGLPDGYTCALAVDRAGDLYVAKRGSLGVVREGRLASVAELPLLPARIAPAGAGGLWICSGRHLFRYAEGRLVPHGGYEARHAETEPSALIEDSRGGVWVGTSDSGLFYFADGKTAESVPVSHLAITSLVEDAEGNVWVGTDGGGLNRVRPRVVTLETAATGLPFDVIQSLAEDRQGTLWATTANGLLARRTRAGWENVSAAPDWPGGRPTCVVADPTGGVWIATKDRMLHYLRDGRYATWRREQGLASRTTHALHLARNGDLWLGQESPDVIQRFRQGQFTTFEPPAGIRIIRAMTEDAEGAIWAGSSRGILVRVKDDILRDETPLISAPGSYRSIRYLHATPDGRVWIAFADEGLGLLQRDRFFHVNTARGLPDDNLSQIVGDAQGWLWIGGNRGIFKVRADDVQNAAEGKSSALRYFRYGPSEGLRSLQANFGDSPGALRAADGRIWMPMRTALASIRPSSERETSSAAPPVLLTRVVVNEGEIARFGGPVPIQGMQDLASPSSPLRLAPDHRRVEFVFTALSFSAPDSVRFRFRLEGFDDGWIEAGRQRSAVYPRLPAGTYRFHVTACSTDGIWNESGAAIALVVRPFLWQRWWFQLALVTTTILVIAAAVRFAFTRRLRRRLKALEQQAALERERARIARDIHDDLGSRLTHATLLVELAQRAPPEKTGAHIHDIAATVRDVSESLDEIIWAVNPRNDVFPRLMDYLVPFAVSFLGTAEIRCRVDVPTELPAKVVSPEVRHHLLLTVKEALTNVARHAQAREVWLRLRLDACGFELELEDDGKGFACAPDDARADGLRNMRQRMQEIGGEFRLASQPRAGTRISLSLPWAACAAAPALRNTESTPAVP